mmetsp:Transcript_45994/g.75023  ORF Transcript_45994/g.75023 Transcript_45994/m.75023 type:complete len:110 (+) Transcript_45994:48-377(+)
MVDQSYIRGGIVILGGAIGYLRKKSVPSLIGGTAIGSLMVASGYLIEHAGLPLAGHLLGGGVSLALAGMMGARAVRTGKIMPAGILAGIGAVGVIDHGLRLKSFLEKQA